MQGRTASVCPVWASPRGARDPRPGLSLLKGVNSVERNLDLAKSPWQFSKCHCLRSLASVLDSRLFCSQLKSVPFLARLFPAAAWHRATACLRPWLRQHEPSGVIWPVGGSSKAGAPGKGGSGCGRKAGGGAWSCWKGGSGSQEGLAEPQGKRRRARGRGPSGMKTGHCHGVYWGF